MEEYFINSLDTISGFIVALIVTYFTTKGKYWADSESLPLLTKEVEKVKSELSILINKSNIIFNEEKEALILFNADYDRWFNQLNVSVPFEYSSNLSQVYQKFIIDFNASYDQLRTSLNRLELFIDDDNVIGIGKNLIYNTYKKKKYLDEFFIKLNTLYQIHNQLESEIPFPSDEFENRLFEEVEQPYKILTEEYKLFSGNINKELLEQRKGFLKICKSYIRR